MCGQRYLSHCAEQVSPAVSGHCVEPHLPSIAAGTMLSPSLRSVAAAAGVDAELPERCCRRRIVLVLE